MKSGINFSLSSDSERYKGDLYERAMRKHEKQQFDTDDEYRAQHVIKLARQNKFNKIQKLHFPVKNGYTKAFDKMKNTALYYACKNENLKMVEFFLVKNSNVDQECEDGLTSLDLARKGGRREIIDILKNYQVRSPRGKRSFELLGIKDDVRGIKEAVDEIAIRINEIN